MRILIVEDDFVSRKVIQKLLAPYGESDIAVNGKEALFAIDAAREEGKPYDLVTLDIMMPEMDGQQVLQEVRDREDKLKIPYENRTKVIMITALKDPKNIIKSYNALCEAYLIKPIAKEKFVQVLGALGIAI